jgi:non-specific serine/threonine protein kinase
MPPLSPSPKASPDRSRTNLPAALTSFVGRSGELLTVRQFLTDSRLVTLVGAGGVGKTRLALRVAEDVLQDYTDGVWLVELAPLADPTLLPNVVAAAVRVRDRAGVSVVQGLKNALRLKHMLLVLDNCEHLVQACAELAEDLLGACPTLQILATSREPLGASGELAWRVPSLDVPKLHGQTSTDDLAAHAATLLFIERARAARPDFRVTLQNASAIGEVCRRLDGMPLALELAATRVRLLSIEQISARLDDQLQLLAGGRRTAPSRQQTLRATLDWSYVLLQPPQRRLFNRLAAFAGSWTLEAAETVCGAAGINPGEVLELLGTLVDQSLVVVEEQSGRVRYRLLEPMRQYAAQKLEESGESQLIRNLHRDWFLAQAERSPFELMDPEHIVWLGDEIDNMRAALRWSIQQGAVEPGLRLARAAGAYWYQRGFYSEGRAWLAELLAQPPYANSVARAAALIWVAHLINLQGELSAALGVTDEGLVMARKLGDPATIGTGLFCKAGIVLRTGDLEQAQSLFEESLSVCRRNGLSSTALEYYDLHCLGLVAVEAGDSARAATLGTECLALAKRIGHVRGSANSLYLLGRAAVSRGDYAHGRELLEQSLAWYRKDTDWLGLEWCLRALGHLALQLGDTHRARRHFRENLALAQASGDTSELAWSLEGLTGALLNSEPDRAVRLAAAAATLRHTLGARPFPWERELLDRWLAAAAVSIGDKAYAAAWTDGRAMPPDQIFGLAGAVDDERNGQQSLTAKKPQIDELSPREREVVRLVARGRTNRQIAEQLVIAPRTADTHVGNILTKLGLHTRAELAVWAVEHGLTPLDQASASLGQ